MELFQNTVATIFWSGSIVFTNSSTTSAMTALSQHWCAWSLWVYLQVVRAIPAKILHFRWGSSASLPLETSEPCSPAFKGSQARIYASRDVAAIEFFEFTYMCFLLINDKQRNTGLCQIKRSSSSSGHPHRPKWEIFPYTNFENLLHIRSITPVTPLQMFNLSVNRP